MGRNLSITMGLVILLLPMVVGAGDDPRRISALAMGSVDPTRNPFTACFAEDPQFTYSAYLLGGAEFIRVILGNSSVEEKVFQIFGISDES